jgi:hypothetical protein
MYKLNITLDCFDDIAKEVCKGAYLIIWRMKARALLSILPNKIINNAKRNNPNSIFEKNFDEPYKKVISEISEDKEYLEKQKKDLDDFLFSDCEQYLKDNAEIREVSNNRMINQLNKVALKFKDKVKSKIVKQCLGEVGLIGFLNRIGIAITTEIVEIK